MSGLAGFTSLDEKKGDDQIQVPGIGMYSYDVLKKKVENMSKDLAKNAKKGTYNRASRNGIRAFAAMWEALAEYDRNAK